MNEIYNSMRGVYGRMRHIPLLGGILRRLVRVAKYVVRSLMPVEGDLRRTIDLHSAALAGIRDSNEAFREEFDSKMGMLESSIARLQESEYSLRDMCSQYVKQDQLDSAMSEGGKKLNYPTDCLNGNQNEKISDMPSMENSKLPDSRSVAAKIINVKKVEKRIQEGNLRLNLGNEYSRSGDEFVNVGIDELPGIDIVGSATNMPISDGVAVEIISTHQLEHFTYKDLRCVVLPYWLSLLRSKGVLRIIVPDTEAAMKAYSAGDMAFTDLREKIFGSQQNPKDYNFNLFSSESLKNLLEEIGFIDVRFNLTEKHNVNFFGMEFEATKP